MIPTKQKRLTTETLNTSSKKLVLHFKHIPTYNTKRLGMHKRMILKSIIEKWLWKWGLVQLTHDRIQWAALVSSVHNGCLGFVKSRSLQGQKGLEMWRVKDVLYLELFNITVPFHTIMQSTTVCHRNNILGVWNSAHHCPVWINTAHDTLQTRILLLTCSHVRSIVGLKWSSCWTNHSAGGTVILGAALGDPSIPPRPRPLKNVFHPSTSPSRIMTDILRTVKPRFLFETMLQCSIKYWKPYYSINTKKHRKFTEELVYIMRI